MKDIKNKILKYQTEYFSPHNHLKKHCKYIVAIIALPWDGHNGCNNNRVISFNLIYFNEMSICESEICVPRWVIHCHFWIDRNCQKNMIMSFWLSKFNFYKTHNHHIHALINK
jgi:hypothetical protein